MSTVDEFKEPSVDLESQDAFLARNLTSNSLVTQTGVTPSEESVSSETGNVDCGYREHKDVNEGMDSSYDHPAVDKNSFDVRERQMVNDDFCTSGNSGFLVNNHEPQSIPAGLASGTSAVNCLNPVEAKPSERAKLKLVVPERSATQISCTPDSDGKCCNSEGPEGSTSDCGNTDAKTECSKNYPSNQWTSAEKRSDIRTESSESPCSEASASSSVTSCTEDSGICSTVRDEELDEIPLGSSANSSETLKKMTDVSIDEDAGNCNKTSNTYAHTGMEADANVQDGQSSPGRPQKQKKL